MLSLGKSLEAWRSAWVLRRDGEGDSWENAVCAGYAAVFGWLTLLACSDGCLCSQRGSWPQCPEKVLALVLLFPSLREEARGRVVVPCDLWRRWDV